VTFELRGENSERQARIGDARPRDREIRRRGLLGHDGGGATFDGLTCECGAVCVRALERHEHVARCDGPGVVGDPGNSGRRLAGTRTVRRQQAASDQRVMQIAPGHGRA